MRLTCPNCGAQYEVPDEVIPETGRDVQCSNCGDTWFQHHPENPPVEEVEKAEEPHPGWDSPEEEPEQDFAPEEPEEDEPEQDFAEEPEADPEPEDEETVVEDVPPEDEPEPEPEEEPELEVAQEEPEADSQDEDEGDGDDDAAMPELDEILQRDAAEDAGTEEDDPEPAEDDEVEPDEDAEAEDDLPRRGLDPAIAELLREEATREEDARAAEGSGGLETQPDLGLDSQAEGDDERTQQAKSRMARMRGLPEDSDGDVAEDEPDPSLISRRNLLPDIDEINSSLDSESVRSEAGDGDGITGDLSAGRKGGFGRGFTRGVLLVFVLVALYLLAPMIGENVPALAGVLQTYVDTVNAGRVWLNDWIASLIAPV